MKKINLLILISLIYCCPLLLILPAYCMGIDDASPDFMNESQLSSGGEEGRSFYHRTLSGKYNLLEDDFDDVPHRTNRYDYIKEKMEKTRLFSRPDRDEIAVLNLQWDDGDIFVNDFKTFVGKIKKRKNELFTGKRKYFYRLFSNKGTPVYEGKFDIPLNLNFDFFDEENGDVTGGSLIRSEADFIIKIPLDDKTAEKVIFYKQPDLNLQKSRNTFREGTDESSPGETVLGESLF